MKLAALVSGGKDSLYAAHMLSKKHEIKCIVSMLPENPESYMFHVPNAHLVEKQAKLMGMPLIQKKTEGIKEKELEDLREALSSLKLSYEIEGIVTGAVQSEYQKKRIEQLCRELGLQHLAPLWHKDPAALLREMVGSGFEIVMTAVAAEGLGKDWLGRTIDSKSAEDLISLSKKFRFSPVGEGGEFETFVTHCPLFKGRIEVLKTAKHWDGMSGWMEIVKVK